MNNKVSSAFTVSAEDHELVLHVLGQAPRKITNYEPQIIQITQNAVGMPVRYKVQFLLGERVDSSFVLEFSEQELQTFVASKNNKLKNAKTFTESEMLHTLFEYGDRKEVDLIRLYLYQQIQNPASTIQYKTQIDSLGWNSDLSHYTFGSVLLPPSDAYVLSDTLSARTPYVADCPETTLFQNFFSYLSQNTSQKIIAYGVSLAAHLSPMLQAGGFEPNIALYIIGASGTGKSHLARCCCSFYPASATGVPSLITAYSTRSSLEKLPLLFNDSLLVVDDICISSSSSDDRKRLANASSLINYCVNGAPKTHRSGSSIQMQTPHCSIVITAERPMKTTSELSRVILLTLSDKAVLSALPEHDIHQCMTYLLMSFIAYMASTPEARAQTISLAKLKNQKIKEQNPSPLEYRTILPYTAVEVAWAAFIDFMRTTAPPAYRDKITGLERQYLPALIDCYKKQLHELSAHFTQRSSMQLSAEAILHYIFLQIGHSLHCIRPQPKCKSRHYGRSFILFVNSCACISCKAIQASLEIYGIQLSSPRIGKILEDARVLKLSGDNDNRSYPIGGMRRLQIKESFWCQCGGTVPGNT